MRIRMRHHGAQWLWLCTTMLCSSVGAYEWQGFEITSRSQLSQGFAIRTEAADTRLIGKLNVPGQQTLCLADGCSSVMGDPAPNQRFVDAAGAFAAANKDDGDLSYPQWSLVNANSKLGQEFTIARGDWLAKVSAIGFFDPSNYNKQLRHTNTLYQPASSPRPKDVRNELGRDWALREAFISGHFSPYDHDMSLTLGWQRVRWGESNFIALNSISALNAPDARLLHQPNTAISDVFRPTPMLRFDTSIAEGTSLQLIYELGWVPVRPDPQGSFYSTLDIIGATNFNISVGNYAEDPDSQQQLTFPGNLLSDTTFNAEMLPQGYAQPTLAQALKGQAGFKLSTWLPDFNNGTELAFYALNYHSQLPYISAIGAQPSCARESADIGEAYVDCQGFKLNPNGGSALRIDTVKEFLDYPRNILMLGASFNTNIGNWSLAGEYSLRPRLPVQVHVNDVNFAALQPAFPGQDIIISPQTIVTSLLPAILTNPQILRSLDPAKVVSFLQYAIENPGVSTLPGSRTAVPDYYQAYTGQTVAPGDIVHGYVRLPVDQFDLTAIRVLGSSENPVGADQVQLLFETGFTHVWNFPDRSELQLEGGDNNATHASPGIDGTGSGGVTNANRQNPTQQTQGFASEFAWGYRVLVRMEYDNLLFGLNVEPTLLWSHDVTGIAVQPMQNFIKGAKTYQLGVSLSSGSEWSTQLYYQGSTGGWTVNNMRDRDSMGVSFSYSF